CTLKSQNSAPKVSMKVLMWRNDSEKCYHLWRLDPITVQTLIPAILIPFSQLAHQKLSGLFTPSPLPTASLELSEAISLLYSVDPKLGRVLTSVRFAEISYDKD